MASSSDAASSAASHAVVPIASSTNASAASTAWVPVASSANASAAASAAGDSEFEVVVPSNPPCRFGGVVTVYSYYNHTLQMPGNLWVDERTSTVLYQSQHGCTDWHGLFMLSVDGLTIQTLFDCNGNKTSLKSTRLTRSGPETWTGYDYASRNVEMRFLEKRCFCYTHSAWERYLGRWH